MQHIKRKSLLYYYTIFKVDKFVKLFEKINENREKITTFVVK